MTKADIMRILEDYPDDAEIVLMEWHENDKHCGWTYEMLNSSLTNWMDSTEERHRHPAFIGLLHSRVFIPEEALYVSH
jgi:hypothetical protein